MLGDALAECLDDKSLTPEEKLGFETDAQEVELLLKEQYRPIMTTGDLIKELLDLPLDTPVRMLNNIDYVELVLNDDGILCIVGQEKEG